MTDRFLHPLSLLFAGALALAPALASGAELKVVSRPDVLPALAALAPQIEELTELTLALDSLPASTQSRRLDKPYDVIVADEATVAALAARGQLAPGTLFCIAWTGLGMAIRAGAPMPDITTVDGLRGRLLVARSIAFSGDAQSGAQFRTVLLQLGIAGDVESKLIDTGNGDPIELVAQRDADVAIALQSEIATAARVQAAGPLPGEVQHLTPIFAAMSGRTAEPEAARRLLALLSSFEGAQALHAVGLDTSVTE
jgi:molybdate transport system substrate-binding protein